MQSVLDAVYVLHHRAYQESHALVNAFSAEHGIITGLVRGVYQKNRKGQQLRAALQIGNQLEWHWQGNYGLKTIYSCEQLSFCQIKEAKKLICLSYVNELLLNLLGHEQACPILYHAYSQLLQLISSEASPEASLRHFECLLFDEIGCHIDYLWDYQNNCPIDEKNHYQFQPEHGIIPAQDNAKLTFNYTQLENLAQQNFQDPHTLKLAKGLHRSIIQQQLHGKVLKSRSLYLQL